MADVEARSEVTGNVWKVICAEGATVEEGDELVILESMKMEIPVEAPCRGVVKKLLVKEGDQIQTDQIIAVIEES